MRRALPALVLAAVAALVAAFVVVPASAPSSESAQSLAASCVEPTTADRAEAEAYLACRAGEVAAGLSSLPPVPTVTATATETATVTATETVTATATATVTASPTPTPTPTPSPTPTQPVAAPKVVGMSAAASLWTQRLSEVGPCGVEARRIFADLTSTGRDQATLIQQAVSQGMMPVLSYKVPSVATLNSGGYDTWLTALHDYLDSLGVQVTVTFWHEPYPDLTGAEFRAGSQKFLDLVQDTRIAVGPILNGWLMDRRMADFTQYSSPALLNQWDFFGVDSYQSGSQTSPGTDAPARAVPLLETWLDSQDHGDLPIGVGEYNGYSGDMIARAGETILSTPEVWFGLVFNSDVGAKGYPLSGDRLTAYQATKADPRALHDPAC